MKQVVFFILLRILFCLATVHGACQDVQINANFLFSCELNGEDFFESFQQDVSVTYLVNILGEAGPPSWLNSVPATAPSTTHLYGTPGLEDVGNITLQIAATRMDTFESQSGDFQLSITNFGGIITQRSEFFIINYNMEELLREAVLTNFTSTLHDVYGTPHVITRLISPASRGIIASAPPAKIGVIIEVTPGINTATSFPTASAEDAEDVQGDCENSEELLLPPVNFQQFSENGFQVDWCVYAMTLETTMQPSSGPEVSGKRPGGLAPPTAGRSSITLVVIIVVCVLIIFMVMTGMAWVFFGKRKKGYSVSRRQKDQRNATMKDVRLSNRDAAVAQRRLRDMSQVPPSATTPDKKALTLSAAEEGRPQSTVSGGLLEYQDVTDYSRESDTPPRDDHSSPPPAYSYPPEELSPPRRFRLITL